MSSLSVLKDSQKSNLPQVSDLARTWSSKVNHSMALNAVKAPTLDTIGNTGQNNSPPSLPIATIPMDSTPTETGRPAKYPVISSTYFASPIRTLQESVADPAHDCISIHDLVEAYNMLSNKIRTEIHRVSSTDEPPLFLTIFKKHSFDIVECLRRDIRRVLPSPFDSPHNSHSFTDLSFYSEAAPNDDDVRTVADDINLCQYALRFASDIFTFPAMYSNFTGNQLTSLLRDVLSLCTTIVPPTLNLPKACAMAIWILKVQQLPISILLSLKVEIISALQISISHQVGGNVSKLDAFKAVHCIMELHPTIAASFIELLPLILEHLNSGSAEVQLHAALALSGFTSAKMYPASNGQFPVELASRSVQTYVNAQTSQGKSQSDNYLLSSFKAALADGPEWRRLGPSFALAVVSCFLVLLDHFIFTSPRSVKLVITILHECNQHRVRAVRDVQPEIWKIMFWAFSRVPKALDQNTTSGKRGIRERAYLLVCEDLRHGRRLDLIGSLLGTGGSETSDRSELDVSRAIDMVADLFKTEDPLSVNEAVATLSRLMAGIGAPSTMSYNDNSQVSFSRKLVDGTLLSQNAREIRVPAVKISIEQLRPLSEKEVLRNWETLSRLWISAVERNLSARQVLSPEILQVWQALLLVHGGLTPGEQHLSASTSFGNRVASITASFTMALDTAERQSFYLSFIRKLWVIMKNVFSTTSLSYPAEKILASLLKKQFTIIDDQVRDLWSQLCGDLISVGIPTLLHVLRVRSESQEETEVTRQLWLLLAENRPLGSDEEDWEDLLQFLVMPFGVWEMSSPEFDVWKRVFRRALGLGAKAVQTPNTVISRFIRLFKEAKLTSLKHSSRTLHWLLGQSITPSDPTANFELLPMIDECILSLYGSSVEKKAYALDTLRLIGELISKTRESEIVQLLYILQKSLSCWIADEEKELDVHEDNELVDILYKPSLEILARVEPSVDVLKSVATFIHSVFVRIRGDGPLTFHKFWRATYHTQSNVSKSDYPLPIQQCLKAWGDFADDSLADGISLDSGSQSLRSYTIPDSQSLQEINVGEVDFPFDISYVDQDQPIYVVAHDYGEDWSSDITPTHGPSTRTTGPIATGHEQVPALAALQEYTSVENISQLGNDPSKFRGLSESTPKRSADAELPRTPKRPRVNKLENVFKPRAGKERVKDPDFATSSSRGSRPQASVSEPVTRAPSPSALPPKSASQPSQPRRRQGIETTPGLGSANKGHDQVPFSPLVPEQMTSKISSGDYDYDSWEQGVSVEDVRHVQVELQELSDFVIPEGEGNPDSEADGVDKDHMTDHHGSDDHDILSPSLGNYPLRSRRRHRSQTAPEPSTASQSIPVPQTLRRNQTTPLEHKRTSSAQLEALQRAYAIVADTGTSQIDVQDIMHARRLANQINQVLDEQMCLKFGAGKLLHRG